jgi:hypothetical protein
VPPDQALAQNAQRSQKSGSASPEEARSRYAQDQQAANDSVLRNVQGHGGGDVVQKKTGGKASASEGNASAGPMSSALAPHKKGPIAGDVTPAQAADFGQDVASHATGAPLQKKKRPAVQAKAISDNKKEKDAAAAGMRGTAGKLPYKDQIQKAFGKHELGDVQTFQDAGAKKAAQEIGAKAYAMGDKIAFAGSPDLHTAAHEAAHVVQQRAGITGGGKWETHADKVADAVVAGQDAEPLLDEVHGGAAPDKVFGQAEGEVQKKASDAGKDFLTSGYFKQQAGKEQLTADLKAGVEGEIAEDKEKLPDVEETMGPTTEETPTDGATEPPADPGAPGDGVEGSDPQAPPDPVPQDVAAPPQPGAPNLSAGEGADVEKAKTDFKASVRSMPSTVDNLDTSPGPAPKVQLSGTSDPARSDRQDEDASAKSDKAVQDAKAKVDSGPGPEQVVPKVVQETHEIEVPQADEMQGLGDIPKAAKFDGMASVKQEIKDKTDEVGQAQLQATVSKAEADLDKAQTARMKDRDAEIANAEKQNKELIDQANKDQDAEVAKQRAEIDKKRTETKTTQDKEVDKVKNKSKTEKAKLKADVDKKVSESEKGIEKEFADAESKAQKEKADAEKKAAAKKREAEKEAENDSWWDRATSAIASAFDALASAITSILDAVVDAVNAIVDLAKKAANALIDAAVKFVSAALEAYGELLKALVDGLLGDIFPGLAKALTEFIDAAVDLAKKAVEAIGELLKKGIAALLDAVAGALKAIIAAYKAAIEAALALAKAVLTGDWEALGKMILEGVLKLAGIPPEAFYALIDQAMGSLDTIIEDPGGFVGNVIDAAAGGFSQFADNILGHLKDGFFAWIVGPIGEMGLTLPTTWDIKGVFGLAAQVLGLTQEGIKKVVTEELGETAGVIFDYVWKYVGVLIEGGIEGLWEQVKQDLNSLYDMVIDGIKSWLIETIVKQAVLKVATMFNPAGALLNAVIAVWNVYEFLRDQVSRIFAVVQSVVNTIAQIAAGNTQPAKDGVENALASLIPIAIDLFAKLLGLGGITKKVKEVIEGVQEKVHGAIRSLIKRVKGMFSGGGEEEKADAVSYADLSFSAPTGDKGAVESHRLFARDVGGSPQVMIASDEKPFAEQTSDRGEFEGLTDEQTASVNALCTAAMGLYKQAKEQGKPELDQQADAKMQEAKNILASVAAANLEAKAKEEGGLAERKLAEVRGDANCSGLLASWEEGSLARHSGGSGKVIQAMQDEVANSGRKYILQGPKVPEADIKKQDGLSRVIDLPAIFNYYMDKGDHPKFFGDENFFATCVNAGVYDVVPKLQGKVRGRLAEGWWFAKKQAPSLDLSELIEQLAIGEDSPQYKLGAIRLDFSVKDAMNNLVPHKPTAFDGMPFGEFVLAPAQVWGVTAGGALEAVAPDISIGSATSKTPVKGPGTMAEVATKLKEHFSTDLQLVHDTARPAVEAVFTGKTKEIFDKAGDWTGVKAVIETDATVASFLERPGSSHAFGDHITGTIAPKALTDAVAAVDGLTLADIGGNAADWVNKRKGAISSGAGRYAQPKQKFGDMLWDKARETEAADSLKATFESTLTETKKVHDKYKPKNVTDPVPVGDSGDTKFTYEGFGGAKFEVVHTVDGMLKSVTGTGLTLKGTQDEDVTGRGMTSKSGNRGTRDSADTAADDRLLQEASHMIADRFRGSGYKNGCNLVTTSAHYNDPVMKGIEDKIALQIDKLRASSMKLTVSVDWIQYDHPKVLAQLVSDRAAEIGADLSDATEAQALVERVKKDLEDRWARMRSENLKRVKNVSYEVELTLPDGKTKTLDYDTDTVDKWI